MALRNTLLATVALVAAFAGGVVLTHVAEQGSAPAAARTADVPAPPDQARPGTSLTAAMPNLSDVAERALEASVNISSTQEVRPNPYFELMYGRGSLRPQTTLGSGVVVSEDGYVLTNSHVVGDAAASIKVTLPDNRELPARIIGIDPYTDLALVKVEARGLKPLPWGDSGKLRVAEWVLAVGNPFTFSRTVTLGIVSAQNRHDPQLATYNDFIQTDAAINPGNSGGALVSARGEVVGINTMIYSETGGQVGIGFAIPSNLASRILTDLRTNGEVVRGWIGNLDLVTITAAQARGNRLGDQGGVFVANMYSGDSAYKAGVLPYDIIVKFNGKPVAEQSDLQRLIAAAPVGSTATIEVIRNGAPKTFQVPVVRTPPVRR